MYVRRRPVAVCQVQARLSVHAGLLVTPSLHFQPPRHCCFLTYWQLLRVQERAALLVPMDGGWGLTSWEKTLPNNSTLCRRAFHTAINFITEHTRYTFFFFLIIYFWLRWVFVAARRLSLSCGAQASRCGGFSCHRAQALGAQASVVVTHGLSSCGSWALERRLSSCGTRA